jgi:pimeloyl-ACP methyl ester carboxylesterase
MGNLLSVQSFAFCPPDKPTPLQDDELLFLKVKKSYSDHKEHVKNKKISQKEEMIAVLCIDEQIQLDTITLIYSHGNSCDIGQMCTFLHHLQQQLHCNIVAYDYLSFGFSDGQHYASEQRCYDSLFTVYQWLIEEKNTNSEKIFFLGESIGSGVSCEIVHYLSTQKIMLGGLILVAPFCSILEVAKDLCSSLSQSLLPLCTIAQQLSLDFFINQDKISTIHCPILYLHGDRDSFISIQHSKTLKWLRQHPSTIYKMKKKKGVHHITELMNETIIDERQYMNVLVNIPEASHNDVLQQKIAIDTIQLFLFINT